MTTTYYTFRTRRVKVSGGSDRITLVPVAQANTAPDREAPAAKVVDFNLCRRHQETRRAWQALTEAAQSKRPAAEAPVSEAEQPAAEAKRLSLPERIELLASASVLVTALSAAAVLLSSL